MRHAQLRAFHSVATWGGFSKAAEKMAISQPALSDHVRKLEEAYGVQLFVRGTRSITLTDLGRKLFALAERQIEIETAARDLLQRARNVEEGHITIGADAAMHALPLIRAFRTKHPAVRFRVISGNSANLIERLEAFEIDFAVVADVPPAAAFSARLLREDQLVAFVASDHPWANRASLKLTELATTPLIMREQGSETRRLIEERFNELGLSPDDVTEIEGREAAREAVVQGLGVGVVSSGEFLQDARLKRIAIKDWQATMREWLVCLKSRETLHLIQSMLTVVDEMAGSASQS
ncbi:MAG: LysR family transcriptional regulator [Rhizobiales bacterium]|nr:LysR family transcriptional regulator [Hyphomicrobiales bacterium]